MKELNRPLCIDLDGTLIRSDMLVESALSLLRRDPWKILIMPFWFMRGMAYLKRMIAQRSTVNIACLPYDMRVVTCLRELAGHRLRVLCTASDISLAKMIADHLGCFDEVIASDGHVNLSGLAKAEALVARFGEQGFDYAGNETKDLHVWKRSARAWVVNGSASLLKDAQQVCTVALCLPREGSRLNAWARALRLHQWLKNLLIFLPVLTAHRSHEREAWIQAGVAFAAFSLCASAGYVLNDLLDMDGDRHHLRKRMRPFASGALSPMQGVLASPLLLLAALVMACSFSIELLGIILVYWMVVSWYSFRLKRVPILDVIILASLYALRIVAGAVAINVPLSPWLLVFSMAFFLSLAMLKRYTELQTFLGEHHDKPVGRGYRKNDLSLIQYVGIASGYLSVLILALYVNGQPQEALYREPAILWLLCPLLLSWIQRAWMMARQNRMHDDPVVYAATDHISLMVVGMMGIALVLAA